MHRNCEGPGLAKGYLEDSMKFVSIATAALLVAGMGVAMAQGDVITERKNVMKAVGAATAPVGRMLQGAEPFDLAKVQNALNTYS
jgi:cytochrome c556